MYDIILASKSPRRQELIRKITEVFEVITADEPDILSEEISPEEVPVYLASCKAGAVAAAHPDKTVIGADTVVILDGVIMGKPADKSDARRMLAALSGRRHKVVTGCCIIRGDRSRAFSGVTEVEFYPLSESEIDDYIATGEPFDKAGAYGIQGQGALLVKGIVGDYFNVMGLPVAQLKRELESFMKGLQHDTSVYT